MTLAALTDKEIERSSKAQREALEAVQPVVKEMLAHLLAEKKRWLDQFAPGNHAKLLPQYHLNDGGFRRLAQTRDDFELLLRPWKVELSRLMLRWPRRDGESINDYHSRLNSGEWVGRLGRMADWLFHIDRIDEAERAEREREAKRKRDEEKERVRSAREKQRRAHERATRQATVDEKEVKRLLAVIAKAEAIERVLAAANDARQELTDIFKAEREGCEYLRKPVPKRDVPGWPKALDPPAAIRPPQYLNGDGPGRYITGTELSPAQGVRHGK
jgi:hypothetical protein